MKRSFRGKQLLSLVLSVALLGGCALSGPRVLPGEQRELLGRLGVATAHFAPTIDMDVTRGRGHSAAKGAAQGAAEVISAGLQSGDGFGFLFSIVLAPIFAAGGAVYGAVAGDSGQQVHSNIDPLDAIFYGTELQKILRGKLLEHTGQRTSQPIVRSDLVGSGADGRWQDYRGEIDLDAVLEIGIREIRLKDEGVTNAKVDLQVVGFARLVQVTDGSVVLEQDYLHRSVEQDLDDWARNGGIRLRDELAAAFDQIAGRIVDDYFLPVAALKLPLASLAATSPLPQFCFFCEAMLEPLPTRQPTLCWQAFPAAADLKGANGKLLRAAGEVVYDLRLSSFSGESVAIHYDINRPCYKFATPLNPCQLYMWQTRSRFRVGDVIYATPWARDQNNRFRASCAGN